MLSALLKGIIGKCQPTHKQASDEGSLRYVPRNRGHLRVKSVRPKQAEAQEVLKQVEALKD